MINFRKFANWISRSQPPSPRPHLDQAAAKIESPVTKIKTSATETEASLTTEEYQFARDQLFSALDSIASHIEVAKNGNPFGIISHKEENPSNHILSVTAAYPPDNSPPNIIGFCKEWFRIEVVLPNRQGEPLYLVERYIDGGLWLPEPEGSLDKTAVGLIQILSIIIDRSEGMRFKDSPVRLIAECNPKPKPPDLAKS